MKDVFEAFVEVAFLKLWKPELKWVIFEEFYFELEACLQEKEAIIDNR